LENVIIKFVADTSGLEPAIKQLELLGKISKDDAAAFAQVNNEQKEFIQNLNKSTTEMGKLSNEVDGLMAEIQAGVMEGFADHLAEVTKESKKAGTGFKSMKAELRELKAQIASGSLGAKEMKEATKRAAELTDTIGDVNDKVKALASDTKRIDAVVTAFSGIAAAASVAAGAAALFGGENEELTKTLAKAQGAMALLTGIQELAKIATTKNALSTFVLDGAQKVATVSSNILGRTITANMALATGGISLLLGGLVYLLSSMDDAEEKHSKITATMADRNKNLNEVSLKVVEEQIKRKKDGLEKELELEAFYDGEARAETRRRLREREIDDDTFKLEVRNQEEQHQFNLKQIKDKYAKLDKDEAEKAQKIADQARLKREADAAARAKLLFELSEQLKQNMLKQEIIQTEYFKSVDEIDAMYAELAQDRRFTTSEQIYTEIEKRLQAEYEASVRKAEIDMAANEQIKQNYYAQTDIQVQFKKTQEEVDAEYAKIAEEGRLTTSAQIYAEITKRYQAEVEAGKKSIENQKIVAAAAINSAKTISDTIFTINQQNRDAETASILESLSMRKDAELANKELTDAQRLQIEERYAQQEAEIKTRAWEAQKQAAIMQAIINGALTIGNILATVPGGPLNPATIASLAAAAIATGAQIAIIENAQPPKFADGGMVGGQLHSSGGTLIEAERGEYVINRQSTSDYLPSLKVLNSGEVEPTFANNILTALANGTFDLAAQFQTKQSASSDGINYDKLDRIMAKHKSNLNVNIDEQGLTTFLLKENSRVEFRNKKMRYRA
jgi:hypothetical protein